MVVVTFHGAYLGVPGSMFHFARLRGSASSDTKRTTSYKTTLGGRLRAQVSPQVLREWSCSLPLADVEESALLEGLATGLFGIGPFAWVPVDAAVTNVLSLGAAMPGPAYKSWSGPGTASGMWHVPGMGVLRHSVIVSGPVTLGSAPVVPGIPVTGAVYTAGGTVVLEVLGADGAVMVSKRAAIGDSLDPVRARVTAPVVPYGAVSARIRVEGSTQVALPQITWTTSAPSSWVPGQGSNQVMIEGYDADLKVISPEGVPHREISFTVKELASDA